MSNLKSSSGGSPMPTIRPIPWQQFAPHADEYGLNFTGAQPSDADQQALLSFGLYLLTSPCCADRFSMCAHATSSPKRFRAVLRTAWKADTHDEVVQRLQDLASPTLARRSDEILTVIAEETVSERGGGCNERTIDIARAFLVDYGEINSVNVSYLLSEFDDHLKAQSDPVVAKLLPQKLPRSTAGWDISRLSWLSLLAFHAGLFTQEEGFYYAQRALDLAKEAFADWDEYLRSQLYGRICWTIDQPEAKYRDEAELWAGAYAWTRLEEESLFKRLPLHPSS
ncbi:DUF1266 domain-containing protein [Corynebacterium heidelbergense]|nr:DUF1266 domain-containing protein [Corynebacterium heidelbergense]